MTFKDVADMLDDTHLPYAYYQFSEATATEPPFVCFYFTGGDDLVADDTNYQKIENLIIELYTDEKDFDTEATIEDALSANDLVYTREESVLDSEHMYMVVFRTSVLITAEENNG